MIGEGRLLDRRTCAQTMRKRTDFSPLLLPLLFSVTAFITTTIHRFQFHSKSNSGRSCFVWWRLSSSFPVLHFCQPSLNPVHSTIMADFVFLVHAPRPSGSRMGDVRPAPQTSGACRAQVEVCSLLLESAAIAGVPIARSTSI